MPIDVLPDDVLLEIFDFITEKGFGPTTEEIECGRHWSTCVGTGEELFLDLHVQQGTPRTSGQPCLFLFGATKVQKAQITSLLHSSAAIVFIISTS